MDLHLTREVAGECQTDEVGKKPHHCLSAEPLLKKEKFFYFHTAMPCFLFSPFFTKVLPLYKEKLLVALARFGKNCQNLPKNTNLYILVANDCFVNQMPQK